MRHAFRFIVAVVFLAVIRARGGIFNLIFQHVSLNLNRIEPKSETKEEQVMARKAVFDNVISQAEKTEREVADICSGLIRYNSAARAIWDP